MPWTDTIDDALPVDTDPAAEGAAEFRQLKRAINERLASRLPGWPATEPLPVLAVDVGPFASRPASPAGDGHVYIANTPAPQRMYYGFSDAWVEFTQTAGVLDNILVIEGSASGITIAASTAEHQHSVVIPGMTTVHEVIGWRYRWQWPLFSSTWVPWAITSSHRNFGNPAEESALLRLSLFEIDPLNFQMNWIFANDDTDPHSVNLEWVLTLLVVR